MTLHCRSCAAPLSVSFCDLGMSPPSNAFLTEADLQAPETFLPLHAYVCADCFLVQLPEVARPDAIFKDDYAYFSSYSDTWLQHARAYAAYARDRFRLGPRSHVIEVASNDGYLLRFFAEMGIPTLGIEPSSNVAEAARALGLETLAEFFGSALAGRLAREGRRADLLVGNNVLAHVPDLNDFVAGLREALAPAGVVSMEFPHLLRLIEGNQFDTIYHEHYSYLSLLAVQRVFAAHGLTVFDVQQLPTHGGSLRVFARHAAHAGRKVEDSVGRLLTEERAFGLDRVETYERFAEQTRETKRRLLELLIDVKRSGKRIAAYGAAAKGNTLLNYCGVRSDFIDYVVDRSPHKQGRYLPGTHLPVHAPEHVRRTRPDYLIILPWNLRDEILAQMSWIREWGGQFIVPIPQAEIVR
ncbi:MAG: class I SAM-dependent methyltransferase [Burkholderiales bacterium]